MENFFRQPVLDIIYDAVCEEFERSILEDNTERTKYYDIMEEEEKLQNELKEIVGKEDKEKLHKLMQVIREIEQYCCEETDYWNRKYFKLGFCYLTQINSKIDKDEIKKSIPQKINKHIENKEEQFSSQVHNFLDSIRNGDIEEEKKKCLLELVKKMKQGTKTQKERFIKYYDLNCEGGIYKLSELSKREGCNGSSFKISVVSIISYLVNLEGNDKEELSKIIGITK